MKGFESIFGIIIGVASLCIFSTFQKLAIGAPLVIKGYFVPTVFGGSAGFIIALWNAKLRKAHKILKEAHDLLEIKVKQRTQELENALSEIHALKGILPICCHCHKIRDEKGDWNKVETYISEHSGAEFSHSICPECAKKYYPDFEIYEG